MLKVLPEKRIRARRAINQYCIYAGLGPQWTLPQTKHPNSRFSCSFYTQKAEVRTFPNTPIRY